jgi:hypothetical protein
MEAECEVDNVCEEKMENGAQWKAKQPEEMWSTSVKKGSTVVGTENIGIIEEERRGGERGIVRKEEEWSLD